jgi:hypothetical protein
MLKKTEIVMQDSIPGLLDRVFRIFFSSRIASGHAGDKGKFAQSCGQMLKVAKTGFIN